SARQYAPVPRSPPGRATAGGSTVCLYTDSGSCDWSGATPAWSRCWRERYGRSTAPSGCAGQTALWWQLASLLLAASRYGLGARPGAHPDTASTRGQPPYGLRASAGHSPGAAWAAGRYAPSPSRNPHRLRQTIGSNAPFFLTG